MSRTGHRVFQVSTPKEIKLGSVTLRHPGKTLTKCKNVLEKSEQQT